MKRSPSPDFIRIECDNSASSHLNRSVTDDSSLCKGHWIYEQQI